MWRGDRSQQQPSQSILGAITSGPGRQEGHIPAGQIWFLSSFKGRIQVLAPCTLQAPWSDRTEKLPVLLQGGSSTPPCKAHLFYWLNQPNRSQHSTEECPLLFIQINRYTHWWRPKDTSILVATGCSNMASLLPRGSNLETPGNGKGYKYKKKNQSLLQGQSHLSHLSYMYVAFVWLRERSPSDWTWTWTCKAWFLWRHIGWSTTTGEGSTFLPVKCIIAHWAERGLVFSLRGQCTTSVALEQRLAWPKHPSYKKENK